MHQHFTLSISLLQATLLPAIMVPYSTSRTTSDMMDSHKKVWRREADVATHRRKYLSVIGLLLELTFLSCFCHASYSSKTSEEYALLYSYHYFECYE